MVEESRSVNLTILIGTMCGNHSRVGSHLIIRVV
jgi:hypothetical protein